MTARLLRSPLPWIALAVAALAALPRLAHRALVVERPGRWASLDPDGLYHMRRVERLLDEGLPVAARDPLLDHPHGAAIPWPPYYTLLLGGALAPFAADEPAARRAQVERLVGTAPLAFALLATLLAALAAGRLAGPSPSGAGARSPGATSAGAPAAAAAAGAYHALFLGSVLYSCLGNGDHHAFVSLLHAGLLVALSLGLGAGALERPRRALWVGLACGALAGIGLGTWVAFLTYVVGVELALAALLFAHARRPRPGLAPLGLGFHAAALALVLPAVLASPWRAAMPFGTVNLTWFHPAFLLLGGAVFVAPALGLGARARRRYPWLVGAALLAVGALALATPAGEGLREAFAWASGSDRFMATIDESRPLLDAPWSGGGELLRTVGLGLFALPFAWLAALAALRRRGAWELLPWLVAVPLLLLQALAQLRFAEGLALPLSVLLGWALGRALARFLPDHPAPRALGALAGLALALLAQQPAAAALLEARRATDGFRVPSEHQVRWGEDRALCAWLRDATPLGPHEGVLAGWGHGHMIEWVAGRPTVATNFGSYIGADSFADPARFFLAEDDARAEALLERREVAYVLLDSRATGQLPDMCGAVDPALADAYLGGPEGRWNGALRPRWFRTVMARLMAAGSPGPTRTPPGEPAEPPGFLRLVRASSVRDHGAPLAPVLGVLPRGWVWERVAGARLVARGEPGTPLRVRLQVAYPAVGLTLDYAPLVEAGPDGRAELRVPYATDAANGDGRVLPGASWGFGRRSGPLVVPEAAVRDGATLELP